MDLERTRITNPQGLDRRLTVREERRAALRPTRGGNLTPDRLMRMTFAEMVGFFGLPASFIEGGDVDHRETTETLDEAVIEAQDIVPLPDSLCIG